MSKIDEFLCDYCDGRNCKGCCIREILPQCGKGQHITFMDRKTKELAKQWIEASSERSCDA